MPIRRSLLIAPLVLASAAAGALLAMSPGRPAARGCALRGRVRLMRQIKVSAAEGAMMRVA